MANRGDFVAPIAVTDQTVRVEHAIKYVCRECGTASSDLVDGICWRHRPIAPRDQPSIGQTGESHAAQ